MPNEPLIKLTNLTKTYHLEGLETTVLNQVSLSVSEGELLAIVGASGSGKTTLMNIIGLLDKTDSGSYQFQQRNIEQYNEDELALLRNKSIGFVFQQFNLLPRFNAEQNVALPLIYRGLTAPIIKERVREVLTRVGMQTFAQHRPSQLSGGQQQRIAIARALVSEPHIILADEPTGSLDSQTGMDIMNLFLRLHEEGRTLIIVTHDDHIAKLCKRQIMLSDGQIIAEKKQ